MEISFDIKDEVSAALERIRAALADGAGLHASMSRGAEDGVKGHLVDRGYAGKANSLGGASTGFWKRVHDSVVASSTATLGTVEIGQRGFSLRYYGGVVSKKADGPNLSAPVDGRAHGKSASLFPGELVYGQAKKGADVHTTGYLFLRGTRKLKKDGSEGKGFERGDLMYVLRDQTTHEADPDSLPSDEALRQVVLQAAADYLESVAEDGL